MNKHIPQSKVIDGWSITLDEGCSSYFLILCSINYDMVEPVVGHSECFSMQVYFINYNLCI